MCCNAGAKQMRKELRKPTIKNKYNLTVADVKKLRIGDRNKVKEPLFWRNNVVSAWCIIETVGKFEDAEYWLGIYDDDASAYKGKFRFYFSSHGGMCDYKFKKFFDFSEIENEYNLEIQEKFLSKINFLIDEGILLIPEEKKKKERKENEISV